MRRINYSMVGMFTIFVELRKMYDENMGHKTFILYSVTIFKRYVATRDYYFSLHAHFYFVANELIHSESQYKAPTVLTGSSGSSVSLAQAQLKQYNSAAKRSRGPQILIGSWVYGCLYEGSLSE
jgi:hypothetical protein